MPNRNHSAFGGGWAWQEGEEDTIFTPEELLDCYIRSVGRNSNLLLGMAISTDGDFQDEEQFIAFGKLLRETFGTPIVIHEKPESLTCTLTAPEGKTAKYLVIREDITDGQRIRKFAVTADGREVYRSNCVGHKRIIPLAKYGAEGAKSITFQVTETAGEARLRDVAVY